jgi:hypothetical protein
MADDIKIVFTADISELQRGLAEATSGVVEVTGTLKAGAEQVRSSFASLNEAYAAGMARRIDLVKAGEDEQLAVARAGDRAETDIELDAIKLKQSQVKQEAQLSQLSHDEERAQLLALESDREQIELRHLTFLQSTYKDNATAFANTQRQIDELQAQSALKRQEIERSYTREVYADYRRTFEQVSSSVSSQIVGIIKGHETLRQAVSNVLLSIVQSFIQARLRAVADWAAGVVAETAATSAGETSKTAAVLAGTAARTGAQQAAAATSNAVTLTSIADSIIASAAETFAGIFGFLSPLLGPAAAGPAAAGQATVLAAGAALPSFDTGAWSLPFDMIAQVHRGEMIVPAGPAGQLRDALWGKSGGTSIHHQTQFNITAMDSRDVSRFLRGNGKAMLGAINDSVRKGGHLGFGTLRGA